MDRARDLTSWSIKLHLLAENRLLRELMTRMLLRRAGIEVVGVSENIDAATPEIAASGCEILLTDCLTRERGGTFLSELPDRAPQVRVVLFGMHEDSYLFLKAVYLGVCGYVLTDVSASEMIAAVRGVARGEAVCPPKLCMGLIQHLAQEARGLLSDSEIRFCAKPSLTHRQLELVGMVAKGLTNKEIAASLNLSESTVKNHMRRIMKQVDAEDRYEAVNAVRASGFLPNA